MGGGDGFSHRHQYFCWGCPTQTLPGPGHSLGPSLCPSEHEILREPRQCCGSPKL